jgi:hypothetical protein
MFKSILLCKEINSMRFRISSKEIALTAVFAALYIGVATPPWKIPAIGGKGSLEPSLVLGPVFGFVLGPYLGFIAAFLGAFIALVLPPGFTGDMGGLLMPFTPAISAFVAGCITSESLGSKKIKGWIIGALTLFILIICWFLYFFGPWNFSYGPISETKLAYIVSYPILHITGLMIPLIFRGKLVEFFRVIQSGKFSIPVALACWSAMLSNHMLGNIIYVTMRWPVTLPSIMPDLPKIFIVSIPPVLLERLTFTIVATLISIALIPVLKASKLIPRMLEEVSN